jgi:hypothetical protein
MVDGQSSPPAASRHPDFLWFVACFFLGTVGLFAFTVPLFGFLSYAGALAFPFVVLAEIGFGVAAVVAGSRWRLAYALGNLGLVAGNGAIVVLSLATMLVQPGWQPDPDVWRPVYFGLVLIGLSGGITLGVLMRTTHDRR